jgi:hypothetical protein
MDPNIPLGHQALVAIVRFYFFPFLARYESAKYSSVISQTFKVICSIKMKGKCQTGTNLLGLHFGILIYQQ